jgi:hypothetical protein
MTPKEKAFEIFNKMCNSVDELLPLDVRDCAKVAIDELIKQVNHSDVGYWQEVKFEINKL